VYSTAKVTAFKWGGPAVTNAEFAKDGYTFVLITAEVKNTGPDTITALSGGFSLRDSAGKRFDSIVNRGTSNYSWGFSKDLGKNQYVRGSVTFEVPLPAKDLVLYYDFGNVPNCIKLAEWKIE